MNGGAVHMTLWKQLRYKKRAIARHPEIYAGHYGQLFFLRGGLFLFELIFLRFFIYLPFRLTDLSLREIVQYLRRMDIQFWSLFRTCADRLLDFRHFLHGLGSFSSLPEAVRHLNKFLSDWLYWKRERLLKLMRSLRTPRELLRRMRMFLQEHFRNIRLVRRGAVSAVLGVLLAKLMTVLYFTFAGAVVISFWGFDCIVLLLGAIQITAVKIGQLLSRILEHHIYRVQSGSALWRLPFHKRTPPMK